MPLREHCESNKAGLGFLRKSSLALILRILDGCAEMAADRMKIRVTERSGPLPLDLRPAGELAPSLALPWIVKLRYGVLAGQALLILLAYFVLKIDLALGWISIPLALVGGSNWLLSRNLQDIQRPALSRFPAGPGYYLPYRASGPDGGTP